MGSWTTRILRRTRNRSHVAFIQEGTRVVPQICTDVRTREVGSDRRNEAWSPENVLVNTVARLQQDLISELNLGC